MSKAHDITSGPRATTAAGAAGRNVIAVIGIDRYHHWPRLANAVNDAMGAAAVFQRLGFEQLTAPLVDDAATGKAIQSLVTDDLKMLGPDDSLVLFYAGHGGTQRHPLGDKVVKTGYLIPVDASTSPDRVSTWVDLEGWLRTVSLLPARHILVVLDACHSGIVLDPIIKWRDIGTSQDVPLPTLQARRSRRIITSALDDQLTLDSGPVHGHSLFTGCLVEGLTEGLRRGGRRVATGSALGLYVQQRVQTYPQSQQTPDFGAFAFDDRGEMVIPLVEPVPYTGPEPESAGPEPESAAPASAPSSVAPPTTPPPAANAVAPRPQPVSVRLSRLDAWVSQVSRRTWYGIVGIILGGFILFSYVIHDTTFGIAAMITASLVASATMIGRRIPVLRWLSERILRRKLWVGGATVAILVGAGLGLRVRGQLQDKCDFELALADGLLQAHRDGAGQAYADAAKACKNDIGRDEEARRAAGVASEWRASEAARKAAEQKAASSATQRPETGITLPPPPEPAPPLADKAGEVPALEAALAADPAYAKLWDPDHADDRNTFLTAISDALAHGALHTVIETATKKAKLYDAFVTTTRVLARTGKLPSNLTPKIEAHLASVRTAPRHGLWNPDTPGQPLVDATAVALWLHPNDVDYVRERMRALLKGPFPMRTGKGEPIAREWLAMMNVIDRLRDLSAFTQEDCTDLHAKWSAKILPNGQTQYTCEHEHGDDQPRAADPGTSRAPLKLRGSAPTPAP